MSEFINTFQGGMHKDNALPNQPKGTYRHAENVHIISQDGNNYAIKDCLGNVHTFTLNIPYSGTIATEGTPPTVLSFVSFPDGLYVLYSNGVSADGFGGIGRLDYTPYGVGIEPDGGAGQNAGFTPLYHHADLNFNCTKRIEALAISENDDRRRIYWTDNYNDPRVINVANPIFTTYFSSGALVSGTRYMVLQGAIAYNDGSGSVNYGPGLTAGNVFTATGVAAFTGVAGTPKVIEYFPYELLSWTPDRTLGRMSFAGFGTGEVYYGSKIYLYRFGLTDEGIWTPWSYPSNAIHIHGSNETGYLTGDAYHNAVGNGTSAETENSTKSVQITITGVDTNYDKIEMACVEFDQDPDAPRQITIVDSQNITGEEMTLEHTGIHLGDLTVDDLTTIAASIHRVKTIATNKNYFLAANVTERPELDLGGDYSDGITIESFQYGMPIMSDPSSCSNLLKWTPYTPVVGANPANTTVTPNSRYYVVLGELSPSANTVTYDSVEYVTGEVIVGVDGETTITCAGTAQVRPCVTKNKYTDSGGGRVEDAVLFADGDNFWDYRSALVDERCRGYWSAETYRFGVLFYDLKGNPYYVRWIGDYELPSILDKSGLLKKETFNGASFYSLNPSGIKISGLKIPSSITGDISGFSIVRAPRDRRIITQGLVAQCNFDSGTPNIYQPVGWIQPQGQVGGATVMAGPDTSSTSYYTFMGPDHLVNYDTGITLGGSSTDTLEMASWLTPYDFGGGVLVKGVTGDVRSAQVYLIEHLTGDSDLQSAQVNFWKSIDDGESIDSPQFDSGDNTFRNQIHTNTSASGFPDVVDTCSGGGGVATYNSYGASGGRKCVFTRTENLLHHNTTTAYNSTSLGSSAMKILMNYCVENNNPYGGQGSQALANTTYISTGHFQEINSTVLADVGLTGSDYVFNDIEIFGGDCFVSLVDYTYALFDDSIGAADSFAQAWTFPCESNVNYHLRRGRKASNVMMYPNGGGAGGQEIVYSIGGVSRLEEYSYNPGYSTVGDNILYPALPTTVSGTTEFPTRIRFAGPRVFGSKIDTFRSFLSNNYTDLDAAGGRVNKIAVKSSRVIVWQDLMTGTVPVLERQLLSGAAGVATTLGQGGILDRFDVILSDFGTQHQWSVIESDNGFVWFDMRRKALMTMEGSVLEISQALGMKSYFDEVFDEASGPQDSIDILNSPTFDETSDQPIAGLGITGVYDPKLKTTYIVFKFRKYNSDQTAAYSKDFTIGYYHPEKKFIGFFDFWPSVAHNHNGFVFACNNPKNKEKPYPVVASTAFVVGDTVSYSNAEWVCISDVTIASGEGEVDQVPTYVGSVYWAKVNQINQVWVNNQPHTLGESTAPGYQYNKWFGLATTSQVDVVINPGTVPINVQRIEQVGNNVYPTTVYIEAGDQTAQDTSIQSWNKNYRFIWDRVCSSLPLSTTGRVVNNHLLLKIIKKNWTTDRRTVTTSEKILNYIKSFFVLKR